MCRLFDYPDAKQVLVSGDIHGDFKTIVFKLCVQYGCTNTLLIVAGDCGFGFEQPGHYDTLYSQVAGRLRKANNWVAFIRGNHDEPAYFQEEKISYDRWRTIPDYGIIRVCDHNILCIGGATSIDRSYRKEEIQRRRDSGHHRTAVWWENEPPVFSAADIESIPSDIRIDTVVTHTAPSFCEPIVHTNLKSWVAKDSSLIEDVDRERKTMDAIYNCIREQGHPVTRWYYGHFHESWFGTIDGIAFTMLDIQEFSELHNYKEG